MSTTHEWSSDDDRWEGIGTSLPEGGFARGGVMFFTPKASSPSSLRGFPTPTVDNRNENEDLADWLARREAVKLRKRNGNGFGKPLGIAVREITEPGASVSAA